MFARMVAKVKEFEALVASLRAEITQLNKDKERTQRLINDLHFTNQELQKDLDYYRDEIAPKKRKWQGDKDDSWDRYMENNSIPVEVELPKYPTTKKEYTD